MKVGILTFQWASNRNFGASLQSYACMKLLQNVFGKENVEIINYNQLKLSLLGKIKFFFEGKGFREYNKKFLNLGDEITSYDELKKTNEKYDIFSVGSDQVWRGKWRNDDYSVYFLEFVKKNKIKMSYAASFGVETWDGTERVTEKVKPLIRMFDYISVREKSGIDICKNTFGLQAEWVLDPTLMLSKEEYMPIVNSWRDTSHLKHKYIAHMLLDDNKELKEFSKKISDKLGAKINYIKGKTYYILGKEITIFNKVSQWLTYLKDSELVITDSFHCTVFSLIFNKKFLVIANKERGMARLESLLSLIGLEERFITNLDKVDIDNLLEKEIDYLEVYKKLENMRNESINFLQNIKLNREK